MRKKENRFKVGTERLLYLIAIMTGVVLLVSYIWFNELYKVAIETERKWLVSNAKSQARLIEAIAKFDVQYSTDYPAGSFNATLSQIKSAHEHYVGFGDTGEYTLAKREGDKIVFLLRHRHHKGRDETDNLEPILIKSGLAIPMVRALEGKSGTVIGLDYRGVTVLAAFEPVKELNLGIVAKVDLEEIREPFITVGLKVGAFAIILILAGAGLFVYVALPIKSRLQEDEIRMRHLFESANDAIFIIDPETRHILDVNEKAAIRLGYTREEILQLTGDDIASPNSALNPKAAVMDLKEKGSFIIEHIHLRKDGTDIPVEISSRIVELDERKVILSFARDITERKKAEEALLENNEVLEKIFETTHLQMVMLDSELNFIRVNKKYAETCGYTIEYLEGKNHFDLFPSEELEHKFRDVVKTGEPYIVYSRPFEHPDHPEWGISYWDLAVYPIKKKSGEVDALLFTLLEVTERERAEDALKESEEKYRTLFENSLDMVYMISSEGEIIDANTTFIEALGYSREEMIGNSTIDFWHNHEDRESFMAELESKGFVKDFEMSVKSKSGKKLDCVASAVLVRDDNGEITCIQGMLRDITERKRAEQEMIKAQGLESVGLLAGGIAHDFNNLLMLIAGNLSLLKIDYKEDSNTAKQLKRMENALTRAKGLTNQLLTFSRGGAPLTDKADISRIIMETAEFAMRGSKSKCTISVEPDLPYVKVDEDQISQVIQNIVINASHSMSEGGIISIDIVSEMLNSESELPLPVGDYIKISIGDKGEGISSEYISKIFDPYFTTKVGGTGLGLSTSYSIVQKHNGLLTVESVEDVGTSFHIYLPVCESPAPVIKEEESSVVKGEGRILVMDDEKKIRETIGEMLSILGYVPTLTSSGEEAIKVYEERAKGKFTFDAVMLDLTIRLREINADVIAIVSSGYSNDPVISNYSEYGFKGTVKKPYSIVKLGEMLKTVLADSGKPSPV